MKIEKIDQLREGNIWCRYPVTSAQIDAGEKGRVSPVVAKRLRQNTPFLMETAKNFPGWTALHDDPAGSSAAFYLACVAILLQRSLYWPVEFIGADPKVPDVAIFEARKAIVGRRAAESASTIITRLLQPQLDDAEAVLRSEVSAFQRKVARATPAFDTLQMVPKADARGIPWRSLTRPSFVKFGSGKYSKMLYCSESSDAPLLAKRIAKVKPVASKLMEEAGLPVARHKSVRSARGAVKAAGEIGGKVVIKPAKGRQGMGITVGVEEPQDIERAVDLAKKVSRGVQVEAFVPGDEYRLLVIGGRFVAASKRLPAHVVGNGESSVADLVATENTKAERFPVPKSRLSVRHPIPLDETAMACLERQGLTSESIPERGQTVVLRDVSNVSQGGESLDFTDQVHPSIRKVAEQAARILRLDACGVDFLTTDITRPYWETGGAICELNTQPGLSLHYVVSEGRARDVAADYFSLLYPEDAPFRVPTVLLLDPERGTGFRSQIEKVAAESGLTLGVFRWQSKHAGEPPREARGGRVIRFNSMRALMASEEIDAALIVARSKTIERRGLGVSSADLAVVPVNSPGGSLPAVKAITRIVGADKVISYGAGADIAIAKALGLPAEKFRQETSTTGRPSKAEFPTLKADASELQTADGTDPYRAVFVGDVGFGESYVEHSRAAKLKELLATKGHSASLEGLIGLIGSADYMVGNLEVPLSWSVDPALKDDKKYLGWSDPEKTIATLKAAGFDAFGLANNHALDCGIEGLNRGRQKIEDAGLSWFGAGENAETAARPMIREIEVSAAKMTLVVFGGFQRRVKYLRDYNWYADDNKPGVAMLDPERIGKAIAKLRPKLTAPLFIVYPHWGIDYEGVSPRQEELAGRLAAAGADLIVGHGAHVLQPVALVDGCPVVYGLGNFVWNTPGRFDKAGAPPFGAVCALDIAGPDELSLKLYPILTNTRLTEFQNRPVKAAEFKEVMRLLSAPLGTAPARLGKMRQYHSEFVRRDSTWRVVV